MGYGIIVHCEAHLDQVSDTDLVGSLIDVIGTNQYPTGGLCEFTSRPWSRAGAFHDSSRVNLCADSERVTRGDTVGTWGFEPRGLVGEHDNACTDGATVWWVYADAVGRINNTEHDRLAAAVRSAARGELYTPVAVGNHTNALNCVGRILDGGSVSLEWYGNRLAARS